jgi:chromosome segregation ATPase
MSNNNNNCFVILLSAIFYMCLGIGAFAIIALHVKNIVLKADPTVQKNKEDAHQFEKLAAAGIDQLAAANSANTALAASNRDLTAENERLQKKLTEKEEDNRELAEQIGYKADELHAMTLNIANNSILITWQAENVTDLREMLDEAQTEVRHRDDTLAIYKMRIDGLAAQLETVLSREKAELQARKKERQAQEAELRAQNAELEKENEYLRGVLDRRGDGGLGVG